ncbi:autotransporter assembly complex protein TamA [Vibrio sp. Isolate25]|uniref:autotransporter assembly complex protein TamA n=1 Tax=Vibrio TaxID=662 RepID=UPI001EFC4F5A|nr:MULTISPECIES: autotransporter assembly complex family protein [Vibrio]MCG9598797.1 autotransporter assembly complex protein TamA [Vibrio sp. Isolate25]MCG9680746.1 autotransporter assembly complex protein TamA [Vibrio sp. Isolate24]USD32850.1 outer membrane protein assembly factor [Vibrio sp. SCSIO 43186]USD45889.1 outer membrane protein assembly factor [Vibrio sp. SCSIO 43145]USD69975.1 outer membrane protein assembly factor [Vibrio sp. SCSIO 43139]
MIRKSLPVILLASGLPAFAQTVDLSVEGLSGELETNVDAYLSSIPEEDYNTSLRFQARLEKSLTEALNALGYYHPDFSFRVEDEGSELVVVITPGSPVLIKEVDIQLTGEASDDRSFKALIRKSGIHEGEVLNHSLYDGLKSGIRNLALQKGYFEGDYTMSRLEVSPDLNEAFIRLHFDSGIRYAFGEKIISGSQIEEDRVGSLAPFKQGDPYQVSQVGEFNQNLSNTDWFSSVFVEPDLSMLGKGRELPVKVSLAPQAKNKIETGLGYSTDVGVKGSLKWKKPWVNARGHSFDSSFSLSGPEQTITAGYRIPLEDALNEYYQVSYGMKNVDNRNTKSLESNLAVERHWLLDNGWHRTLFVRYLLENYEQGLQDDSGQFVLPGVTFSRSRIRGGAMPRWGDSQTMTLEFGDDSLLSETRVIRLQAGTTWIRSLGRNHRGLLRLDGGANFADEFDKLSPSLRFFAGGDNNLRGYGYESISPQDSSGALTGAKYIATSSLEYQYRFYGKWWGALFYDYGDAFNDQPDFKRGTGFGVRWASPVGPIRLDFAWGLDATPGDEFKIHFTLGPEL